MSEVTSAVPKTENALGTEKIGKLLLRFSIPGIISMLVNSIYNLVDQIFIGQGVGYLGNAATNVNFPFVQMMLALSIMVAAGTAANVGLNLGRKQEEEADHFVGTGFIMALTFGILVCLVGELFMEPLSMVTRTRLSLSSESIRKKVPLKSTSISSFARMWSITTFCLRYWR